MNTDSMQVKKETPVKKVIPITFEPQFSSVVIPNSHGERHWETALKCSMRIHFDKGTKIVDLLGYVEAYVQDAMDHYSSYDEQAVVRVLRQKNIPHSIATSFQELMLFLDPKRNVMRELCITSSAIVLAPNLEHPAFQSDWNYANMTYRWNKPTSLMPTSNGNHREVTAQHYTLTTGHAISYRANLEKGTFTATAQSLVNSHNVQHCDSVVVKEFFMDVSFLMTDMRAILSNKSTDTAA